ncbi:uncharacterized protein LOC115699276 isoform X2 [Cannabis sativa]|uniref:uncharacterized protein LOC115699276 isoform X2 n=1 Tax=Cannabis sativa TaxID=3483 RepID=UPI0029CA062D|nr:uncharacterized protein LOC115699276 isoform X2 [Cannabis sativa]
MRPRFPMCKVQEKLELCTLQVAKNKLMKHVEDLTLRLQLEKLLLYGLMLQSGLAHFSGWRSRNEKRWTMRRDGLRVAFEASKFCNEGNKEAPHMGSPSADCFDLLVL